MMTIIMRTKLYGLPNTKLPVRVTIHNTPNSRASCSLHFRGGNLGEMEITKILGSLLPETLCWKIGQITVTVCGYAKPPTPASPVSFASLSYSMPSLAKKLSALAHIFLLC
jgi:hypothetical protein